VVVGSVSTTAGSDPLSGVAGGGVGMEMESISEMGSPAVASKKPQAETKNIIKLIVRNKEKCFIVHLRRC
jgi:hypothetical protein